MILRFRNIVYSFSHKNSLSASKPHASRLISVLFVSSSRVEKSEDAIPTFNYLTGQHHFSPESASEVSRSLAFLKNPKNSDAVLSFLKDNGFSNNHLEIIAVYCPRILSTDVDNTLKPKIKIFQDFGFSSADIAHLISRGPWILSRSVDRFAPSLHALKGVLGSIDGVAKLLKSCTWFLTHDLEKDLIPNIKYMENCGISSSQIFKYLHNFPRFFLNKPDTIKSFVKKADEMGLGRDSKMFINAMRVVSSMTAENWELKLQLFRDLGFTEDDILDVFRRKPQVFSLSTRKIKDVTKFLCSLGHHDISLVVRHPDLLLCSIEQRIKPRLKVLEILESKNVLRRKPGLVTLCKLSKRQFLEKYVIPHSEKLGGE